MEFDELITFAQAKIAPRKLSPWAESGGVAAAILTREGNVLLECALTLVVLWVFVQNMQLQQL